VPFTAKTELSNRVLFEGLYVKPSTEKFQPIRDSDTPPLAGGVAKVKEPATITVGVQMAGGGFGTGLPGYAGCRSIGTLVKEPVVTFAAEAEYAMVNKINKPSNDQRRLTLAMEYPLKLSAQTEMLVAQNVEKNIESITK
jgi:hypothetical protein